MFDARHFGVLFMFDVDILEFLSAYFGVVSA
jgi:hypothetical protein